MAKSKPRGEDSSSGNRNRSRSREARCSFRSKTRTTVRIGCRLRRRQHRFSDRLSQSRQLFDGSLVARRATMAERRVVLVSQHGKQPEFSKDPSCWCGKLDGDEVERYSVSCTRLRYEPSTSQSAGTGALIAVGVGPSRRRAGGHRWPGHILLQPTWPGEYDPSGNNDSLESRNRTC